MKLVQTEGERLGRYVCGLADDQVVCIICVVYTRADDALAPSFTDFTSELFLVVCWTLAFAAECTRTKRKRTPR